MNIELVKPINEEDFAYKAKVMSDPLSMSYNAGYQTNGKNRYDYETGVIEYPKERWGLEYLKNHSKKYYFAYIKDNDINEYVGYCCYYLDNNEYQCGIVVEYKYRHQGYGYQGLKLLIEKAQRDGIDKLYDCFEEDRGCLAMFESLGFEISERVIWKKFDKEVNGVIVCLDLSKIACQKK